MDIGIDSDRVIRCNVTFELAQVKERDNGLGLDKTVLQKSATNRTVTLRVPEAYLKDIKQLKKTSIPLLALCIKLDGAETIMLDGEE
jgi:hypothetical protein